MSSRHGVRPAGTDGTDFRHRERVAPHYNASAGYKRRITFVYLLHFIVWLVMLARLLPELCSRQGYDIKRFVGKYNLPVGHMWEYAWLMFSMMPSLLGYLSLSKNRVILMRVSLMTQLTCCLGPIVYAIFYYADNLWEFSHTKRVKFTCFGLPAIVILYLYLSLTLQIHAFAVYYSWRLLRSWHVPHATTKKKT